MSRRRMQASIWTNLGSQDADWAVASATDMRHGGWLTELDRFYAEGDERVRKALAEIPSDSPRRKALDFGSGTGRLTFALAERFDKVTAADVAATMLATLTSRAEARGLSNIRPINLQLETLGSDHNFALSLLVLQHLETRQALSEALRIIAAALVAGGWFYLQIPDMAYGWKARIQPRYRVFRLGQLLGITPAFFSNHGFSGMSMLCVSERWFRETAEAHGLQVIKAIAEHHRNYRQIAYVGQKKEGKCSSALQ